MERKGGKPWPILYEGPKRHTPIEISVMGLPLHFFNNMSSYLFGMHNQGWFIFYTCITFLNYIIYSPFTIHRILQARKIILICCTAPILTLSCDSRQLANQEDFFKPQK